MHQLATVQVLLDAVSDEQTQAALLELQQLAASIPGIAGMRFTFDDNAILVLREGVSKWGFEPAANASAMPLILPLNRQIRVDPRAVGQLVVQVPAEPDHELRIDACIGVSATGVKVELRPSHLGKQLSLDTTAEMTFRQASVKLESNVARATASQQPTKATLIDLHSGEPVLGSVMFVPALAAIANATELPSRAIDIEHGELLEVFEERCRPLVVLVNGEPVQHFWTRDMRMIPEGQVGIRANPHEQGPN